MTETLRFSRWVFAALIAATVTGTGAEAADPGTVAIVSDVHFDPFDPPEAASRLATAVARDWPGIFADVGPQAMSPYGRDTNQALLVSAKSAFAEAAKGADFAIFPGDFLAHGFAERAGRALGAARTETAVHRLAVEATRYVAEAFAAAVPGKRVLVALGNTDSECGDYRIAPGGPYLADTRELVRRLAGDDLLEGDFDKTYLAGGYYASRHPTSPKTVIVILNDILWSAKYRDDCGTGGEAAGEAMLAWFGARLERLAASGERLWLVHHIPWGIDAYATLHARDRACPTAAVPFLREPFASAFLALLRKHAGLIDFSISGHLHFDDYRLLVDEAGAPLAFDKVVPAITPLFGQNPGFQILTYDRQSGVPADMTTYALPDLDGAPPGDPGDWSREYVFSEAYGAPLSTNTVAALAKGVGEGGPLRDTFRRYYNLGRGELKADSLPAYACALGRLDNQSFNACYCGG